MPREKDKRIHGKINRTVIVISILFVVAIAVSCITAVVSVSSRRNDQIKNLEVLEQYYLENDYDAMYEYLETHERTYTYSFAKYNTLAEIYHYYSLANQYMEEDRVWIMRPGFDVDKFGGVLQYELSYCFRSLSLLKELEENDYVYNEQSGAEYLKNLIIKKLQNDMLLTDDEISEGVNRYEDFDTDYSELSKTVVRRLIDAV